MPKAKIKPTPKTFEPVDLSSDEPNDETSEDFERFQDFARNILSVPKSEIDKRAAEYEDQQERVIGNPFKKKMIPAAR